MLRAALALSNASLLRHPAVGTLALPTVGAIRWDAWYDPASEPTQAVTRALTPPQYRSRLPFFAEIGPDQAVRIDGNSQAIMDREIEFASAAGIDYWAFVGYRPHASMSIALNLYRASALRQRIRFCMFSDLASWGGNGRLSPMAHFHLDLMRDPLYMREASGRPLYFLGFFSKEVIAQRWGGPAPLRESVGEFRRRAVTLGAGDPVVVLAAPPQAGARWAAEFGLDALGAYAIAESRGPQSYAALAALACRHWDAAAATGFPVVPTVMTGWDRRPRIEAPVPWERNQRPGVGIEHYYETARPVEIADHLRDALNWIVVQRGNGGPNTALIYAWNENDEGGWLMPTYPFDDSRLRATGAMLRSWRGQ